MNKSNADSRTSIPINQIQVRIQQEIRNWYFFDTTWKILKEIEMILIPIQVDSRMIDISNDFIYIHSPSWCYYDV